MSRINTNVSSLIAQRNLAQQNNSLQTSLERLSTGLRINRGKDDPAGLIASQNLRAEKAALNAAIGNAERADQVASIADGGLNEVSSLLTELESLVGQSANDAGLSTEEKEANQLQIDSILSTIDRLAGVTNFQGDKLLDGSKAINATGVNTSQFSSFKVNSASISEDLTVNVNLETEAQKAAVFLDETAVGTDDTVIDDSVELEITGNKGTQRLSFAAGTDIGDIVSAVNDFSDVTGVEADDSDGAATPTAGDFVRFQSTSFGADSFVEVKQVGGDLADSIKGSDANGEQTGIVGSTASDKGTDAEITVNGQSAQVDGLTARINSSVFDAEFSIIQGSSGLSTGGTTAADAITVEPGGATFQIAPEIGLAGQANIGIDAVTSGGLGRSAGVENDSGTTLALSALGGGGFANAVDGDLSKAQDLVRGAIQEVSGLRGRIGAFQQNTIGASIRSLGVTLENTAAAESQIRDADFAEETANLTRAQILQQAGTNSLALANNQGQSVLSLLS